MIFFLQITLHHCGKASLREFGKQFGIGLIGGTSDIHRAAISGLATLQEKRRAGFICVCV